jgi:hypothetical protein
MPAKNRVEYAYYHLTRLTQVYPWWLMLTQAIPQVWIDLKQYYDTITNQENDFLNPVLVLQVILTIQALPPLHKELFTELEWVRQTIKLAADEQFQDYLGRANMNVEPYWSARAWRKKSRVSRTTYSDRCSRLSTRCKMQLPYKSSTTSCGTTTSSHLSTATDHRPQQDCQLQSCWKVITNLIKDNYSFFFEQDEKLKNVLKDLRLISSDDDLEFLKAMIRLKAR